MVRSLIVAALAAGFANVALAHNIEVPPCGQECKTLEYVGCVKDGNPSALIMRSNQDQGQMTVEKCGAVCKGNGFRYAGLKYYGICFCGNTLGGSPADEGSCSYPCSGNNAQKCGGDSTLSVWEDKTYPKKPEEVSGDEYKAIGCYTDDTNKGRTLSWPVNVDSASITPSSCIAACKANGFAYAGTEFGGECWCGSFLNPATQAVDASQCNIPCHGDSSVSCGGRGRLTVYEAKVLISTEPCIPVPPPISTSVAPPASTAGPGTSAASSAPGSSGAPGSSVPASSNSGVPTLPGTGVPSECSAPPTVTVTVTPSSTGPVPTGPASSGPESSGPGSTGPGSTGPASTGPESSGPASTGPQSSGPATTGPESTGPVPTGPVPTTTPATCTTVVTGSDCGPVPTTAPNQSTGPYTSGPVLPSGVVTCTKTLTGSDCPPAPTGTGPVPTGPETTGPQPSGP
ncbi:hypothetical protein MANI_111179, partial [Metarhizium anisopliae]